MDAATVRVDTVANRCGPKITRVRAAGEVDYANAALLSQALVAALAHEPGRVDVDLAEVTFIDCAGIRALACAGDSAGMRLRLVAASEQVRWLLRALDRQPRFDPAV